MSTSNINRVVGFVGNVTITPPDPARRINTKPRVSIVTEDTSVVFTLKIKGGAPLSVHQETFTARDDSGHTVAATVTIIVQLRGQGALDSLHRDRLRQVTRLIHIASAAHSDVISQQL